MKSHSPIPGNSVTEAQHAYERLRSRLLPATSDAIAERLLVWQEQISRHKSSSVSLPELVMRPGLPPRPLSKHYFKVVRSL